MRCEDCSGTGESLSEGQPCFTCNGTCGLCDVCGEALNTCICDDGPTDCDDVAPEAYLRVAGWIEKKLTTAPEAE